MWRIIATAIVAISFVPSFARAEELKIEVGQSIVNRLVSNKAIICHGVTKSACETAHNDVIEAMRSLIAAQIAKASAKQRGDRVEVSRLSHEIIRISDDGWRKSAFLIKHFPAQKDTVGAKN